MHRILILNSGSATLKFKIFSVLSPKKIKEELSGIVERIGLDDSFLALKKSSSGKKEKIDFPVGIKDHNHALGEIMKVIGEDIEGITHVGHRVVHGGEEFTQLTKITPKVIDKLRKYNKLAPLHNPINLSCIEDSMENLPDIPHFAIFDTAYYKTIPDYVYLYALPLEFHTKYKIRRYGFHGISHRYAAIRGAEAIKKPLKKLKIITCHLGSGASITATKNGDAVDTTMGFTPLDGLTMSTRAGDLDAAIPLYMIEELKFSTQKINDIFNKQSGLLGIAGTKDMREILSASGKKVEDYKSKKKFTAEEKRRAKLALKIFIYDVVRYIGQFTAIMGGLDLLVFTGGIGERSSAIRKLILGDVKHLGKFKTVVVDADEELMIAKRIVANIK